MHVFYDKVGGFGMLPTARESGTITKVYDELFVIGGYGTGKLDEQLIKDIHIFNIGNQQ